MLNPKKGKLCGCGCGEPAPIAWRTDSARGHVKGRAISFINGHNSKQNGGGLWIAKKNRVMVQGRNGSKLIFSRIVMENEIGRALNDEEVVHHEDENPLNNHPDNLRLFANQQEHLRVAHGTR